MKELKIFKDLGFAVAVDNEKWSHAIEYRIFEIVAEHPDSGDPMFQRNDSPYHPDPVETIEEAEAYISGSVKWDGCSNWFFRDDCYHFCGHDEAEDMINVGKIMAECWKMTKQYCPNWYK